MGCVWGGGGGNRGLKGGGMWAQWGQCGVRVEKVPRREKFFYKGLGGTGVAVFCPPRPLLIH